MAIDYPAGFRLRGAGHERVLRTSQGQHPLRLSAVVGGFEFAGGLVLGVGAVVEAAIGERAAQPFVEEENEQGNPGLRRGRL